MKKDENITLEKLRAADEWLKKENGGEVNPVNIGTEVIKIIKAIPKKPLKNTK